MEYEEKYMTKRQAAKYKDDEEEYQALFEMIELGLPLTRTNYLETDWGMEVPENWGWEHEMDLPEELQDEHMRIPEHLRRHWTGESEEADH